MKINHLVNIWGTFVIASGLSVAATASPDPLAIRNLNPLLTGFDLPSSLPADIAIAPAGQIEVSSAVSNTSQNQRADQEHLQVDAEIRRWQLTYAYNVGPELRVQIEVPYQTLSGGKLDGFIENFHRTFNLPNGNRSLWPRNRLLLSYSDGTHPVFFLNESNSGIGDVALRAAWRLRNAGLHQAALWMSLKLPTGDADKLTGSGAMDLSMTLATQFPCTDTIRCYQQMTVSRLGRADYLGFMQRSTVWSGALGCDWSMTTNTSLLVELHGRTAAYHSDTKLLGRNAQLSFGPRYSSGRWQTTFSLAEDIAVDTAPDIQFQLNIKRAF